MKYLIIQYIPIAESEAQLEPSSKLFSLSFSATFVGAIDGVVEILGAFKGSM